MKRRDMLKIKWEFFLVRLGLKTNDDAVQNITNYFLEKGWHYGGIIRASSPEDVVQQLREEVENSRKIHHLDTSVK